MASPVVRVLFHHILVVLLRDKHDLCHSFKNTTGSLLQLLCCHSFYQLLLATCNLQKQIRITRVSYKIPNSILTRSIHDLVFHFFSQCLCLFSLHDLVFHFFSQCLCLFSCTQPKFSFVLHDLVFHFFSQCLCLFSCSQPKFSFGCKLMLQAYTFLPFLKHASSVAMFYL
jgi:hypothetical protein